MDFITLIYFADISRAFCAAMVILSFALTCLSVILAIAAADSDITIGFKPSIFTAIGSVVCVLLAVAFPSKEGIYTMAAAKGVEMAAANPDVKRLAGKSLDVLEGAMDKYIKESKSEDKKDE